MTWTLDSCTSLNHPFSLIPSLCHHPLVEDLLKLPPDHAPLLDYFTTLSSSLADRTKGHPPAAAPESLKLFAHSVIQGGRLPTSVVITAIVYLSRVATYHSDYDDLLHRRVLLGALLCANKYLNDSCHKGATWARISANFTPRAIMQIELDFFFSMKHKCSITNEDILAHHGFLTGKLPIAAAMHDNRGPLPQTRLCQTPCNYQGRWPGATLHARSDSDFCHTIPSSQLASMPRVPADSGSPDSPLYTPAPPGRPRRFLIASDQAMYLENPSREVRREENRWCETPSARDGIDNPQVGVKSCAGSRYRSESAQGASDTPLTLADLLRRYNEPVPSVLDNRSRHDGECRCTSTGSKPTRSPSRPRRSTSRRSDPYPSPMYRRERDQFVYRPRNARS